MKRVQPHFASNNSEGWTFDVEDDSLMSDNTPLRDVLRAFNKHCKIEVTGSAVKAVANGRTMIAVSPWYACQTCGNVLMEYAHRPHISLSGRKYCGPCAAKALKNEMDANVRKIIEKKRKAS